ncbi:MAG: UDP-N-acetylmuramate dehydrogenase, partial [Lachnospiraceae bacterium]|nr:UDP-N-acetylmuramate dehydrogenase [Lachnospiraceae bacterium]
MISESQINELKGMLKRGILKQDELMKGHTSFKVGGPAEIYIEAPRDEFLAVLLWCAGENIPCYVIGNGSNLLVGDGGIKGVVIATAMMSDINVSVEKLRITAEAGVPLPKLAQTAAANGLGGLEFAAGIPGTVGGAVTMNAGAYGGEIKDIVISAEVVDKDGRVLTLSPEELMLSYRHSCIPERELIVLSATFAFLERAEKDIREEMADYMRRRAEKQPLELPSAGSTFKRPEGFFAGKLIEDAGLKGYRVGDAAVSEKHSGFVVNMGAATAKDITT